MKARHYCRTCDEFWFTCECKTQDAHGGHRLYIWTPDGILAIPNFDALRKTE